MPKFTVLYDANVLYPAPLRDFLMHLALVDLFAAKWTDHIHEEWISSLLAERPDLRRNQLERTKHLMNSNVRDALVEGYEDLIPSLELPDPNDRHVLAAAIVGRCDLIVTANVKDFPDAILRNYGIEAQEPDEFICHQLGIDLSKGLQAAKAHRASLKNPTKSPDEYLNTLKAQGLLQTVDILRRFKESI